uniref:Septin-type G domain-containing protein n=1 Tax=Kryptolebias marmoratus TaxID=37003 RepID=A0A3Q2ZIW6_KRYMA
MKSGFRSEEEGQTSDVIVYQIIGSEDQTLPYSLTIIDTPGLGGTSGVEHDVKTNQQLLELFQSREGVHELHAVGLVMKESENQPSDRLKYIFDSLMSLFGKNLEKSIIALITHSNGRSPKNVLQLLESANIKCAENEMNQPVHFLFNNCQDEDRTEDTELSIEHAWRVTQRGMTQFTAFLDKSSPLQLEAMLEEQREQIRLTACIQNLKDRIRFTELKQRDINEAKEALCKYESQIKKDQKFIIDILEVYKEVEGITNPMCKLGFEAAICCLVCQENCHYPGCTKVLTPQQCEVMREGKCTSCTRKCPAAAHVKQNWKYVIRTKKDQKTKKAIQQKYDQNQTMSLNKLSLSQSLENEMKHLTAEKSQLVDEAYRHFIKLEQITQNEDSVSAYVHLDFLMKKMKDKGHQGKLRELQEIDSRMDERTRAELQHRRESVSTKHEDLISASVLIQPGPPAVYQLRTKKKMFGSLSRRTVGEKDKTKTNKTILLVGETGTGKSTLINALFNHTMGVKFEDEVWFQVVEEEEKNSQTESRTSDVIVYQIFGFEGQTLPYSLTIIDTPGFGSTRGSQEDVLVSQRLFDLFRSEEGVHEIHAVGLVMKASMNRVNERLKYIFDSVMSLFGKDLEKNIVALITHSNGNPPINVLQALEAAGIQCAKDEKNQPVYFLFDNQQKTQRGSTEINKIGSKYSWDFSNEHMGCLTDFLENSNSQPLITTVEVLKKRIRLKACTQNLQERIKLIELKQTEIKQIQEALSKHEEEMKKSEKLTVEVDEVYKDTEDIKGGMWGLVFFEAAVTCPICEENCHYPGCTMAWKPSHCEVMKRGRCTVCTKKCPASDHVKENWKYVTKTRKVQKTMEDVKQKYEKSRAEHENKSSLLENLELEAKQLTTEKSQLLDEAYQHVIRLEQIALKVNSLSTSAHLNFLIEKMKENGDTEKVQILEALKSRMS